MYATTTLTNSIQTRNDLTFYSKYGDVFATACLFISGFIVMAAFGKKMYQKVRNTQ
jgi:apolipoprotein N-acyltransferase